LWFLATNGDAIVGACLCFAYPSTGWVRQLGVGKEWQRKGIGSALLRHAFGAFKARGFDRVGLSVESKRPDAFTFYQRVGMKPIRQYDEFVKITNLSSGR
jgi:ribosomal protein S18 acetylase RimI-like enzyme